MTGSPVPGIVSWLLPPVVGAVAGYVLTFAAVRLLARPLLRRAGRRIPEAVRSWATGEQGRARLARAVSSASSRVLELPLSRVARELSVSTESMAARLEAILRRTLNTPALFNLVRTGIANLWAGLSDRPIAELARSAGIRSLVTERLLPLLADPARRAGIAGSLASLLSDRAADLLDDETLAGLEKAAEPLLPSAGERVAEWLASPETRAMMSEKGRELLPRVLERLNVVQRLLLSAGQFDRRLVEKMPEIVDDTVRTLQEVARDPAQQKRVLGVAMASLRDWRDSLRGEPSTGRARARLKEQLERSVGRALARLEDSAVRDRAGDAIERWLAAQHQTLGGFARTVLGVHDSQIIDFAAERVLTLATGERAAPAVALMLSTQVTRYLADNSAVTVGEVFRVDEDRKGKLDMLLTGRLADIIARSGDGILGGLDLENGAVLLVTPHLRWVELYGALLGGLIGFLQLLLRIGGVG